MKKLITLFITCLLGTIASWAEETLIYGRALTANTDAGIVAWSSADVGSNAWNGNAGYNETYGIYMSGSGNRTTAQSFSITEGAKVTIDIEWNTLVNTGNSSNYSYLRIGDNIEIQSNQQNQVGNVIINGTSSSIANANGKDNGNRNNDVWTIHAEINTAQNKLNVLTLTGSLGTKKATYSLADTTTLNNSISGSLPITLGFVRAGGTPNTALQAISIYEEQQEVTTVGYTINYIYENEIKKTVSSTIGVGSTVNAESPISIDGVKYYAANGATTSLTIGSNATQNVLNVNLRQALTSTVNINAVDGENNILKTFSGTRTEGDAASNLYYTRAVLYDGKYYTIPAANGNTTNYGRSMAYGADDVDITYTIDESIVYYAEESGLNKTRSYAAQGMVPERASGGDWQRLYANSHAYTAALSEGIYKIDISARNQRNAEETLQFMVRNSDGTLDESTAQTLTWGASGCAVVSVENIAVPEGASLAIVNNTAYNSNIGLDYVIVYRTGDLAESITITASGYASYVTTNALDFSDVDGLTAYQAVNKDDEKVMLEKVTEVPAETPIIVKGTAGETYSIPVGTCSTELTGNILNGSSTTGYTVEDGETVYALRASTGKMHPVNEGVTIPAKKAYLKLSGVNNAKALTLCFAEDEEEATAIATATADPQEKAAKFFNAAGQQVSKNYNGMVIDENGNKYIK